MSLTGLLVGRIITKCWRETREGHFYIRRLKQREAQRQGVEERCV